MRKITGSLFGGLVWAINFQDADRGLINTWAYRWVASLWMENLICISPNRNIASYHGAESGTHTRTNPRWQELEILNLMSIDSPEEISIDEKADKHILKKVFQGTYFGSIRRMIESVGLRLIK
jgi:hypothetical protein